MGKNALKMAAYIALQENITNFMEIRCYIFSNNFNTKGLIL